MELEQERMALELQEQKKGQVECDRRLKEQEQKIENLSTMVINYAVDDRDLDRRNKKVSMSARFIYFHLLGETPYKVYLFLSLR